jgi:hypothetical protein
VRAWMRKRLGITALDLKPDDPRLIVEARVVMQQLNLMTVLKANGILNTAAKPTDIPDAHIGGLLTIGAIISQLEAKRQPAVRMAEVE